MEMIDLYQTMYELVLRDFSVMHQLYIVFLDYRFDSLRDSIFPVSLEINKNG